MHDPSVASVSLVFDRPFDKQKLDAYLGALVDERGDDIFRLKGIVQVGEDDRRYVLQGVHRLLDLRPMGAWDGAERSSKFVFIGRNLDRADLQAGLAAC
jgi:G3E family GTPase